ncbi:RNA ligase-domain-containing protein [Dipodascopsis uninucleata]
MSITQNAAEFDHQPSSSSPNSFSLTKQSDRLPQVNEDNFAFSSSGEPSGADTYSKGKIIDLPFEKISLPESAAKATDDLFRQLLNDTTVPDGATLKASKVKIRHSEFRLGNTDTVVHGWKFNDWDYKKQKLPTYARGLFSVVNSEGKMEIVSRGYDKFFNIDETTETKWSWIEENTMGPYYLTQKENGCIIFLSGLPDGNLLVCSKHATGSKKDSTDESHAEVGEKWVERHLSQVNLTKRDLAATLRHLNCTAVAELCDDTFEEHILEYEGDRAGLYLHGLNLNTPDFKTYPFEAVCQLAEYFGFKQTKYLIKQDVQTLKLFLDECAERGAWEGLDVEGFVVRCRFTNPEIENSSDYFFKFKFEEPYLMYRQWREVTKKLLSGHPVKIKNHKKITEQYLKFAQKYFKGREDLANQYKQNHGIIALRNAFLKNAGLSGSDMIQREDDESDTELLFENPESVEYLESRSGSPASLEYCKFVIVPVATIGCGKTTISLALAHLFDWGHIQNDNIPKGKGAALKFATALRDSLVDRQAVIADRNNHMCRERQQIYDDISRLFPIQNVKYICLHFLHEGNDGKERIRRITMDRVLNRGDNHQSIHAASDSPKLVESIMNGFLHRFQSVDMNRNPDKDIFNLVINIDVSDKLLTSLTHIISAIHKKYPQLIPEIPRTDVIEDAIDKASNYKPEIIKYAPKGKATKQGSNKQLKQRGKVQSQLSGQFIHSAKECDQQQEDARIKVPGKEAPVTYFALNIPSADEFKQQIEHMIQEKGADMSFWNKLKTENRIQDSFHVTLVHISEKENHKDLWLYYYEQMLNNNLGSMKAQVKASKVIWDNRVMCVAVNVIPFIDNSNGNETQNPVVRLMSNKNFHITIGTVDPTVPAVESNFLLQRYKAADAGSLSQDISTCDIREYSLAYDNIPVSACKY